MNNQARKKDGFVRWTKKRCSQLLKGSGNEEQIANRLFALGGVKLEKYAKEVLGDSLKVRTFIKEFCERRKHFNAINPSRPLLASNFVVSRKSKPKDHMKITNPESLVPLKKENIDETFMGSVRKIKSNNRFDKKNVAQETKGLYSEAKTFTQNTREVKVTYVKDTHSRTQGRVQCNCAGKKHPTITNCTACGKIICKMEGEGECFFCGSIVSRNYTIPSEDFIKVMQKGQRNNNDDCSIDAKEIEKRAKDLEKAIKQKNQLHKFSKERTKRMHIIDEQEDFYDFEVNPWMSEEKRNEMEAKQKQMEKKMYAAPEHSISIDLVNRKVTTAIEDDPYHRYQGLRKEKDDSNAWCAPSEQLKNIIRDPPKLSEFPTSATLNQSQHGIQYESSYYANDTLRGRAKQVYEELTEALRRSRAEKLTQNENKNKKQEKSHLKIQHDDPFESAFEALPDLSEDEADEKNIVTSSHTSSRQVDKGLCLSMHQPWASLVVHGIKQFEGRGWSTDHRGFLWIASTAREPDDEEIAHMEKIYQDVYGPGKKIPFPKSYPKSTLLGRIEMVDCLSDAEFQTVRTSVDNSFFAASNSQFHFACEKPQMLRVAQPIRGNHKLWTIQPKILSLVQPALKNVSCKWRGDLQLSVLIRQKKRVPLDLWLSGYIPKSIVDQEQKNSKQLKEEWLAEGFLILRNYMSLSLQQKIINICRNYGIKRSGFYRPTYRNTGHQLLYSFCLGKHWNLQTGNYEQKRSDFDNVAVPPIPAELLEIQQRLVKFAKFSSEKHPPYHPISEDLADILIVNFYQGHNGKLGMHQDKDESPLSLQKGVISSLSIGCSCDFIYGNRENPKVVRINSGDAMLFWGPSRMVYHGIRKIIPRTIPRHIKMKEGRINLTFRKF